MQKKQKMDILIFLEYHIYYLKLNLVFDIKMIYSITEKRNVLDILEILQKKHEDKKCGK